MADSPRARELGLTVEIKSNPNSSSGGESTEGTPKKKLRNLDLKTPSSLKKKKQTASSDLIANQESELGKNFKFQSTPLPLQKDENYTALQKRILDCDDQGGEIQKSYNPYVNRLAQKEKLPYSYPSTPSFSHELGDHFQQSVFDNAQNLRPWVTHSENKSEESLPLWILDPTNQPPESKKLTESVKLSDFITILTTLLNQTVGLVNDEKGRFRPWIVNSAGGNVAFEKYMDGITTIERFNIQSQLAKDLLGRFLTDHKCIPINIAKSLFEHQLRVNDIFRAKMLILEAFIKEENKTIIKIIKSDNQFETFFDHLSSLFENLFANPCRDVTDALIVMELVIAVNQFKGIPEIEQEIIDKYLLKILETFNANNKLEEPEVKEDSASDKHTYDYVQRLVKNLNKLATLKDKALIESVYKLCNLEEELGEKLFDVLSVEQIIALGKDAIDNIYQHLDVDIDSFELINQTQLELWLNALKEEQILQNTDLVTVMTRDILIPSIETCFPPDNDKKFDSIYETDLRPFLAKAKTKDIAALSDLDREIFLKELAYAETAFIGLGFNRSVKMDESITTLFNDFYKHAEETAKKILSPSTSLLYKQKASFAILSAALAFENPTSEHIVYMNKCANELYQARGFLDKFTGLLLLMGAALFTIAGYLLAPVTLSLSIQFGNYIGATLFTLGTTRCAYTGFFRKSLECDMWKATDKLLELPAARA